MDRYKELVGPADLEVLQQVLDRHCVVHGVEFGSVERSNLATLLFSIYQGGVTSPDALEERLDAHSTQHHD